MKRFLLLSILFLLSSFLGKAQNIFLLTVGVSDYPGWRNDLKLSTEDAMSMYELYMVNERTTSVLLTNTNARKERIISEADNLFRKAGPDDIVVFFFSGHGYKGGFVAVDDFLTYEEIRQMFSGCKARNKMIFADACLSGGIREENEAGFTDNFNNVMLFLSSRSNEYSYELYKHMRNSVFTACLVRSLKGGADANRDRVITARELFNAVSFGVDLLSQGGQHPVMWGSFADDMPVMVW